MNKKSINTIFFIFEIIFFLFFIQINNGFSQTDFKLNTIVLDAGHGGKDPGAVGKISYEKNIVLKIVLKIGRKISQAFPDINLIYTRDNDTFIELIERAEIANRNNADFFISVHVNASPTNAPTGTSTYVMGLKSADKNMAVAKRENSVISIETNTSKYKGFNTDTPENNIILQLRQNTNMNQSISMASKVQKNFRNAHRKDLGVFQAGLIVLYNINMPGVLIETGFISNETEEKWLNTEQGQNIIADAIFRAFQDYKTELEAKSTGNFTLENSDKKNDHSIKKTETKKIQNSDNKNTKIENISDKKVTENQIVYKIQFKTSPKKLDLNTADFKNLKNVSFYQQSGIYKYTIGEFLTLKEAQKELEVVKKSYKDAFIIKFKDGKRAE